MKTVSLRTLLRDPLKVKRMTRTGESVEVTDNRQPLWILQPARENATQEAKRIRATDELLDEVLGENPSKVSAAQLLEESRR